MCARRDSDSGPRCRRALTATAAALTEPRTRRATRCSRRPPRGSAHFAGHGTSSFRSGLFAQTRRSSGGSIGPRVAAQLLLRSRPHNEPGNTNSATGDAEESSAPSACSKTRTLTPRFAPSRAGTICRSLDPRARSRRLTPAQVQSRFDHSQLAGHQPSRGPQHPAVPLMLMPRTQAAGDKRPGIGGVGAAGTQRATSASNISISWVDGYGLFPLAWEGIGARCVFRCDTRVSWELLQAPISEGLIIAGSKIVEAAARRQGRGTTVRGTRDPMRNSPARAQRGEER
jgi:hypothetical protein